MRKDKEWLKEEVWKQDTVMSKGYIYTDDLMSIINELEEPKKPVIPQFVADWYESEGKRSSWWNWFYKWGRGEHRTDLETKTIRWMQDFNEELFVDMFRFGYEVEEEQKYYVLDSEDIPLLERANNQTCKTTTALSI